MNLAQCGLKCLISIGQCSLCLFQILRRLIHRTQNPPFLRQSFQLLIEQLYFMGVKSLTIIMVAGLFIGAVLSFQSYATLAHFGATQQLGQWVALSVVRELGPVVTALLFAGRVGSALTAEIGLMKTTEQLVSLEMMGVDSIGYVAVPRFWAGIYAVPLLTVIFNCVAIVGGGYGIAVGWYHIDSGAFWSTLQSAVSFQDDIFRGLMKSVLFGWAITWIAIFQGYETATHATGVAKATTQSVVYASLAVLTLDVLLTAIMLGGNPS